MSIKKQLSYTYPLIALALATFTRVPVSAQPLHADPFPGKSAVELIQQYNIGVAGAENGQALLVGVLNKTLSLTDTNLKIVRQSLAKAGPVDDKILLIKILASMYSPRLRTHQNLSIETDIKKHIHSLDPRLAAEATIEYSRLGYPPDRYEILQRAHRAKKLDNDAYYGELAHGLRFSQPVQQLQMLDEIETSRNPYAHEVLAFTFSSEEAFSQLDAPAKARLFKVLSSREPNFPLPLDSFGALDMTRYVIWMDAVAEAESELSRKTYAESVLKRLSGENVDPRKILAVFAHPEGQRVIRESKNVDQLRRLLARADAYAYSLPQNMMLHDAARAFRKQMAGK